MAAGFESFKELPAVKEVRCLGMIAAVELWDGAHHARDPRTPAQ